MAVRQPALVTADEFEAFLAKPENRNWNYELIEGVIEEKKWRSWDRIASLTLLACFLTNFTRPRRLGIPAIKCPVQVPTDPYNYRFMDVALVLDTSLPINELGPCLVMPDIVGEIKASTERYGKLRRKARFYTAHGVKLVWLLFPGPKTVEVYRPHEPRRTLTIDDSLNGYDILPGFSVPVRELFPETHGG